MICVTLSSCWVWMPVEKKTDGKKSGKKIMPIKLGNAPQIDAILFMSVVLFLAQGPDGQQSSNYAIKHEWLMGGLGEVIQCVQKALRENHNPSTARWRQIFPNSTRWKRARFTMVIFSLPKIIIMGKHNIQQSDWFFIALLKSWRAMACQPPAKLRKEQRSVAFLCDAS